eukprot:EG_transcript_3159
MAAGESLPLPSFYHGRQPVAVNNGLVVAAAGMAAVSLLVLVTPFPSHLALLTNKAAPVGAAVAPTTAVLSSSHSSSSVAPVGRPVVPVALKALSSGTTSVPTAQSASGRGLLAALPAVLSAAFAAAVLGFLRRRTSVQPVAMASYASTAASDLAVVVQPATGASQQYFGRQHAAAHNTLRLVAPAVPHWGLPPPGTHAGASHTALRAQQRAVDDFPEMDDVEEKDAEVVPPNPVQGIAVNSDLAGRQIPVTILSGFLGSGKTTALKHLLENREGLKVGVVVNDVAAVNIDSQLIQNAGVIAAGDTVQLENGCACCSMQDELLASVGQLINQGRFDHIVVELSGVAEPSRVQGSLEYAKESGDPLAAALGTENVVTVVDVSTFGELCITEERFSDRAELGGAGQGAAEENVATLLIEQIESANLVILNKTDTVSAEEVALIRAYVTALNKDAKVIETQYGKVAPHALLAGKARKEEEEEHDHSDDDHDHDHKGHDHEHDHDHKGHVQEHDHGHDHAHAAAHDHTHDHDHEHEHEHATGTACSEPNCTDPSHHHDHDHDHEHDCHDPNCTDPSHHHHAHEHTPKDTTRAKQRFGIDTYVYKARRPFNTQRLIALVENWPVPRKSLLKDQVALLEKEKGKPSAASKHPFTPLLRSKGFVWVTSNPRNRVEWAHAGKNFGMYDMGPWWASFTEEDLTRLVPPEELQKLYNECFEGEFGDRRIELVFIGIGLDTARIKEELDKCLLTDHELDKFRRDLKDMEQPLMFDDEEEAFTEQVRG